MSLWMILTSDLRKLGNPFQQGSSQQMLKPWHIIGKHSTWT